MAAKTGEKGRPGPGDKDYDAARQMILEERRIAASDELAEQSYLVVPKKKFATLEPLRKCLGLRHLRISCSTMPDVDPICDLPLLEGLVIRSTWVGDLGGLARAPALRSLMVTKGAYKALAGVSLELERLVVHLKVDDLTPLEGIRGVRDLRLGAELGKVVQTRLPDLPGLERLNLRARVESLEPLAHLVSLRYLDHRMSRRAFRSLEGAQSLTRLTHLRIEDTGVEDLEPLRDLPLEELAFRGTKVRSIEPLLGNTTLKRCRPSDAVMADRQQRRQLEELLERNGGDPAAPCSDLVDFWPEPLILP